MANTVKSHKAEKTKSTRSDLADEIQILKRALILQNRHEEGKYQLKEFLSHEMRKYPPSLAEENIQTKETMLRTGNKSSMLGIMKEKADLDDWPTEIDEGEITSSVVLEVMCIFDQGHHYTMKKMKIMPEESSTISLVLIPHKISI